MEIRRITLAQAGDLNLKNEPFSKPGRLIPELKNGRWTYHTAYFAEEKEEVFPEEQYNFEVLDRSGAVFGAYEDGRCIGLAVYRDEAFRYLYLSDLKVCAAARGKGAGRALIQAGMEEARKRGYMGLSVIAQEDNLNDSLV